MNCNRRPHSMASGLLFRQQGSRARQGRGGSYGCTPSDLALGLASPGAFPCPEGSPSFNVQFSRKAGDGHLLAFGTEWGKLVLVDTRAEAAVQRDRDGPVGSFARPGGVSLSSRRRGGICGGWGVGQPAVVAEWRAVINCIFDLEWIRDDAQIALACGDGKCRVDDTETCSEVLVLSGHSGSVKVVSANPLQQGVLLTGSRDGSFALWDTRLEHSIRPDGQGLHGACATECLALATAPSNRLDSRRLSPVEQVYRANIPAGGHRKRPWSYVGCEEATPANSRRLRFDLPCQSSVTAVEWMPDGRQFLTAGQDGFVKLWDTRYILRSVQAADTTRSTSTSGTSTRAALRPIAPTPHSRWVPNGDRGAGAGSGCRGGARRGKRGTTGWSDLGRIEGGEVVAEEFGGERGRRAYGVSSLHACDDGSRIAVCTVKNRVSVYAYVSGELRPIGAYTGNENNASYYIKAKLSPDGSLLASGATDDAVCLWEVDCPGEPIVRLLGHANEVTGVDWCRSDPLKLASCSDDETVRTWTVDPQRLAHSVRPTPASRPSRRPESANGAASGGGAPGSGFGARRALSSATAAVQWDAGEAGPQGKFGVGVARMGESTRWKCRENGRKGSWGDDLMHVVDDGISAVDGVERLRAGEVGHDGEAPSLRSRLACATRTVLDEYAMRVSSSAAYAGAAPLLPSTLLAPGRARGDSNTTTVGIVARGSAGSPTACLEREAGGGAGGGGVDGAPRPGDAARVFAPASPNKTTTATTTVAPRNTTSSTNSPAEDAVGPDRDQITTIVNRDDENAVPSCRPTATAGPSSSPSEGELHTMNEAFFGGTRPSPSQGPDRTTEKNTLFSQGSTSLALRGKNPPGAADRDASPRGRGFTKEFSSMAVRGGGRGRGRGRGSGWQQGLRKGKKGTLSPNPSPPSHHTLMAFWKGGQGGTATSAAGDVQGKACGSGGDKDC